MELKKNTGITLVALIVSIIVMLILAGVSINAIIGDNGIVNQAINAKEGVEEAELWEQIQTILVEAYAQDLEEDEFVEYCNNKFDSQNLAAIIRRSENDENWSYVLTYGIYSRYIAYLNWDLSIYQTVAAVESTSEYWDYDYNDDGTITLKEYKGSDTEIVIPNIVDGYLVTALKAEPLFNWNTEIISVTFSEGLETIGSQSFSNCSNLETISNFPSTLVTIGDEAFYGCSKLSSTITFTSSMESVGESAFYNCSNMDGTVENLIRTNVSYGLNAFYGCASLSGDVSTAMSAFLTDDDTEIPDYLFSGWSGLTGTITIRSSIERIGKYAFYGCSGITGIDISSAENLEEIGGYAFYNCISIGTNTSYSELDFSSYCTKLESLGTRSFAGVITGTQITRLTIPSSVTSIGESSFYNCTKLTTITLDSNGTYGSNLFNNCTTLNSVTFGSNFKLTTLPEKMFYNCTSISFTSITIPSSITTISENCFCGCTNLATVNYSSSLAVIEASAFYGCTKLTTLPLNGDSELISSLITISDSAFYNCGILGKVGDGGTTDIISLLESSNVTTLGNNAFYGCAYLSGTIADSIIKNTSDITISQGGGVFTGTQVESARTFTLADTTGETIEDSEFQGTTKFVTSDIDDTEIYTIEIPEGVTSIGDYAFDGCTSITKVIIPYTVTSIGKYAFNNCTALVEVVGKNSEGEETEEISGVISLGQYCFAYCSNLKESGTFEKVTDIPDYCWYHCGSLENFDFNSNIAKVGSYAFCSTSICLDLNLTEEFSSIGEYAFANTLLTSVSLDSCSLTSLGNYCFSNCINIEEVILPPSLKKVTSGSFSGCSAMEVLDFSGATCYCVYAAFSGCSSLKYVKNGENVYQIGEYNFRNCDVIAEFSIRS